MMAAHKHLFQDAVSIAHPERVIASTLLLPKCPEALRLALTTLLVFYLQPELRGKAAKCKQQPLPTGQE